ncbi:hypothetical protein DXG01_000078 [Tephrocybe rancida]|nr:hypothetical protein DXG01_000078 [Tephrocybe rancida]
MTSLPTAFSVASFSSGQSVRDAIASCSRVTAASDAETFSDDDEEAGLFHDEGVVSAVQDDDLDQFGWEAEDDTSNHRPAYTQLPSTNRQRDREFFAPKKNRRPRETTPLLRKAISFSTPTYPRRLSTPAIADRPTHVVPEGFASDLLQPPQTQHRRPSASSARSLRYNYGGKSTFGQTLFNSIAILLGIGMLSEPLAFAFSGWVGGTTLIVGYGFISCYTAKILARIVLSDPRVRSYADIGRKAFGQSSMLFISLLFCFELFSVSVVLVTLYADSLHSLIPEYPTTTYKLWGLLFLIPTIFLPLSLISYTSILGILSSILIIFVIFIDGFSKPDTPGSFWSPAETNFGIKNTNSLGVAFGLFMAGFSGHSVIPSLARDMIDPTQFDRMINWAFFIATLLYTLIGYAGYLMFGNNVSEEISMDLVKTSGYSPILNQIALWMLVISPLSKFALTTQPLNATIEILLGIDVPLSSPEDMVTKSNGLTVAPQGSHVALKRIYAISQRITVTVLSVMVSILVPDFGAMMAFLGSFAAFLLCLIGPISAKVVLAGRCGLLDGILLVSGVTMAIWGTVAAFLTV